MLTVYPAIFYQEKSGDYSVIFPDLNNLSTWGENLEDAMRMAVDCLAGYIHTEQTDGQDIPAPTPIEKVLVDDAEPHFVTLVSVDVEEYARQHFDCAVKKTLSIPAWLNEKALARKINFSQLLQRALKQELGIEA